MYQFSTQEGEGTVLRLKTRALTDTYTLTAEFTEHPFDPFDPEDPILTLPATGVGKDITITLSAEQVDTLKTAYFRVRAVKTGVDIYIEDGKLLYSPLPQVAEVRDGELILIDQFGREYNAGAVQGPPGEDAGTIVVLGDDGAENSAAIMAAFDGMMVDGRPSGRLILRGANAPIASTLTFDLGYTDVTAGTNWASDDGHRFYLEVEGSLTPAAGIGTAVVVKNGFGTHVDVSFEGGGQAGDIGLHVENLMRPEIAVEGANFAGTVLHADAGTDITKRIRQGRVTSLSALTCGQALYWRGIEAFGTFDFVWDNNCVNGSEFIDCADVGIGHWESFTIDTQDYGLEFNNCNAFQVAVISMGDRPSAALIRIVGGDFGRINQIRASGKPGIVTPEITGLLLEEVKSIDIDTIHTFRCAKGISIVGGGENGIRIKQHRSLTTDINPLHIAAGVGTAPRIKVHADYRYHQGASVLVGPGLTGGSLNLSGYLIDMHNVGGAAGKYAVDVDATSGALILDVDGLEQVPRTSMAGFTNHPTFANILGVFRAKLGNNVRHGSDPASAGIAINTSWQNTSGRPAVVSLTLRTNSDATTQSYIAVRIGPNPASILNIGNVHTAAHASDMPIIDRFVQVVVPPYWYLRLEPAGTGGAVQSSFVYYL